MTLTLLAKSAEAAPPQKGGSNSSSLTQNWDTKLPNESRFTVLPDFNNQAVRDNETGLVWERSAGGTASWEEAVRTCWLRQVAGRAYGICR